MARASLRISILITGFWAASASADNCADLPQTEMNICAEANWERADAHINLTYQRLLKKLKAPEKTQLRDAQVAWLKYRDLACELNASAVAGGSMQPTVRYACLERITKHRDEELEDTLELFGI